jgi:hypothetical protein
VVLTTRPERGALWATLWGDASEQAAVYALVADHEHVGPLLGGELAQHFGRVAEAGELRHLGREPPLRRPPA